MSQEIERLIQGNSQFKKEFGNALSGSQQPKILVIACCDARVDPALIFNSAPGELFVIRSIANLIPPYNKAEYYLATSAALQYGVCVLNVEHIVVLGHSQCGGITALVDQTISDKPSLVAQWMQIARSAYDKVISEHPDLSLEEQITLCAEYGLINSLHTLRTFPWIDQRVRDNELELHAWYFDIATGGISQYDQHQDHWIAS